MFRSFNGLSPLPSMIYGRKKNNDINDENNICFVLPFCLTRLISITYLLFELIEKKGSRLIVHTEINCVIFLFYD